MSLLQQDETLAAAVEIRASADRVYSVISDVTRIPEWSPETVRVRWLASDRFRAWNRRRLGRWRTDAKVVAAEPGQRFSFVVAAMGGDWTQWTFRIEPGASAATVRLTEEFRMCVALPLGVVVFERLFLFVRDRRADLCANLEISVGRIRGIVETDVVRQPDTGETR